MKILAKARIVSIYNDLVVEPKTIVKPIHGKFHKFKYSHYDKETEMHVYEEVNN